MEAIHTARTATLVTTLMVVQLAILAPGCAEQRHREAFLPDPAPEPSAEKLAAVDALRSEIRPGFMDKSPLAGRWEIMNLFLTPVAVISEEEALDWFGTVVIYTEKTSVLMQDACEDTGYVIRQERFADFFENYVLSREELRIPDDPFDVVSVTCGGREWDVPGAEVIPADEERLLVVWDGVIYVLRAYPDL